MWWENVNYRKALIKLVLKLEWLTVLPPFNACYHIFMPIPLYYVSSITFWVHNMIIKFAAHEERSKSVTYEVQFK